MPYSYTIAKDVLSDIDKNRILCLYLNMRSTTDIDWDKATTEFGAASVASMRVMTNTALKKIEKAGGKVDANGIATPASASKKRKTTSTDGDDEEVTPTPKKRGKKSKTKELSPFPEDDDERVKVEPDMFKESSPF